jgi:Glycosyl hydrolases family 18
VSWLCWPSLAVAAAVLLTCQVAAAGMVGLLAEDVGSVAAEVPVGGDDGLWLGHGWVGGQRTAADLNALVARLRETGIRDLFVHVGPLSNNGSLNPALRPRAEWLLTGLHRLLPGVRVQAWLGDTVGAGGLDLAGPATRRRVLGAARQVLAEGFDGIHLDLEPVPSGDQGYLALLAAMHALTRARHAILSVACAQIEPLPYLQAVGRWIMGRPRWWSSAYLHAVASRVDEVALMTYDTGVPVGAAYSGYVRLQTRLALAAVPPDVTVLIGLPAYHDSEPGHTSAETVGAAIRGVRLALGADLPRRPVGVALYADFSARPADWAAYLNDWVRRRQPPPDSWRSRATARV